MLICVNLCLSCLFGDDSRSAFFGTKINKV
jgi:hypothetical protein